MAIPAFSPLATANRQNPTNMFQVGAEMTPLQASGFILSKYVLAIMGFSIAVLIYFVGSATYKFYTISSFSEVIKAFPADTSFEHNFKLLQLNEEHVQRNQGFVKDIAQMVLLNLLLPILTALLGYIFGTRSEKD